MDKYKILIGGSPGYLFSFTKNDESRRLWLPLFD
nr:MAG TPA: hypothetical protein [Caudoviricetes sp.]